MRISLLALLVFSATARADVEVIRSAQSGPWSAVTTWTGGKVPPAGCRVLVRPGHEVVYDVDSTTAIRSIHIGGTLRFAHDRNTLLRVGLISVQPGESTMEEGFDCAEHVMDAPTEGAKPALLVGTPEQPIDPKFTARIALVLFEGMKVDSLPAIVCCGGRMELHGAVMNRTWVKLGADAKKGERTATLAEAITGWRVGDKVLITATKDGAEGSGTEGFFTEERTITAIGDKSLTFDAPLKYDHAGSGEFRGEVANRSRNVIIESDDVKKARGHTMYHRHSAGSISYAEFRGLGKQGVLGRYSLHFHLCGDTMRGTSVIGASIHNSGNRWITVHGTNYLIVRDCIGYQSVGHGYFLEDGTESMNVFDRNLAIQALAGRALPKQVLPFDNNDGAGFWWANSLNTFTNNVTVENGRYGYRFEATPTSRMPKLTFGVQFPDGKKRVVDIRTLPFIRFDDNEAHCDQLYGCNLGEGVNRVGPDAQHPFIVRNMKIWELHYAFRPQVPSMLVDGLTIERTAYGVYHPNFDHHVYRNITMGPIGAEPFNRGHDDLSIQYGSFTVDGITFRDHRYSSMPLIQLSDDNPTGNAVSHFRKVKVVPGKGAEKRALVNRGGGPRPKPKSATSVPIILHDHYGPGQHARIISTASPDYRPGDDYRQEVGLTGDESRVQRLDDATFPELLKPIDDLAPSTVITHVRKHDGKMIIRGTTSDNGEVSKVVINGQPAKAIRPNFAEWEITLPMSERIIAHAEDVTGNVEGLPHTIVKGAH